ncbi:hypothetical protein ACFPU1_06400 [Thalassorhabdus alkalitolerans]|uniref:Uncharacterized protein n=1 Tax=Thalassorhabdus alkalitolerans TaxID=2282697 RepID=A0ABW0YJ80_9BACI|nr:hypothetical protein [Thalassobacillus sp. C254]
MILRLKFKDGLNVNMENDKSFEKLKMEEGFLESLQEIKRTDSEITVKNEEGETITKTGKELAAVEVVLD